MHIQVRLSLILTLTAVQLALMIGPGAETADAGSKDLILRRLADRVPVNEDGVAVSESDAFGFNAAPDEDAFKSLSLDLGLVFAPRMLSPAETLGEAGFDLGVGVSLTSVDNSQEHWRALEGDGNPSTFTTGQLNVRKGLPFSFEIGGTLTHLFESEMFAVGADVKWALNEGFLYLPDFAVRGTVNNVMGNSDLNLTNAGVDLVLSKAFGLAGVINIAPYVGYNRLWVISSSRLLDVAPDDPTPPEIEPCDPNDLGCVEELKFQPEFVFSTEVQVVDRFFVGSRFIFGYATITLEGAFAGEVQNYTGSVGFDF